MTVLFADVDNLTDDSFEPRASVSKPVVLPLGGRLDIHCRVPDGRPTPSQRCADVTVCFSCCCCCVCITLCWYPTAPRASHKSRDKLSHICTVIKVWTLGAMRHRCKSKSVWPQRKFWLHGCSDLQMSPSLGVRYISLFTQVSLPNDIAFCLTAFADCMMTNRQTDLATVTFFTTAGNTA